MMSTTRTSNWVLPLAYICVQDTHKPHCWVPTRLSILCFPIGSHKSLSHAFLLAVTSRCLMLSYWWSQVVVSCLPIGSHKSLSHAFLLVVTSRCLMLSYWPSQVVVSCFPIGSHKSLSHAFLLAVTSRCLIPSFW
jgi:hypothetical protein